MPARTSTFGFCAHYTIPSWSGASRRDGRLADMTFPRLYRRQDLSMMRSGLYLQFFLFLELAPHGDMGSFHSVTLFKK
jgi:hypothetical protein